MGAVGICPLPCTRCALAIGQVGPVRQLPSVVMTKGEVGIANSCGVPPAVAAKGGGANGAALQAWPSMRRADTKARKPAGRYASTVSSDAGALDCHQLANTSAMRSAARPSHSGIGSCFAPLAIANAPRTFSAAFVGVASRFVPNRTVIGRSVVVRIVMQGNPSTVASSCNPPESVTTHAARAKSETKSR